ncbi:MAG: hypothetical protein KBT75_10465 [Oleispira antarctica]|nr:hypothetical protein [Oleispira antarctica]MBQ0794286.1 hypothetical protein [Oleispira antarctica]
MFNRPATFFLIACSALLSACAHSPSNFWHTSTEQLLENHRYEKAIEKISAEMPFDKALLLKVKNQAALQCKKQTAIINQLVKQKKWGEAREVLEQLNSNQPSQTPFTHFNSLINKAQLEEERLINTRLAMVEAQLLDIQFNQQDLYDRTHHNKINWFPQYDQLTVKRQALAENFLHLSTQALRVKDYRNAQIAYKKAIELDRELGTGEITQAINSGLSKQNTKAIDERRNSLIKQLDFAISTQNFEALLKVQEILSHEPFHGAEVEGALKKAKKTRLEHARRLDEVASKEYRNGNISLAVTQWQQALLLTPTDLKIQERLIRAQKVQRKLEKLTAIEEN